MEEAQMDGESVPAAVSELACGKPIVLVSGTQADSEGCLVIAAECATTDTVAFLVRHTSGFLCVAVPAERCDQLRLPAMDPSGRSGFAVTVDVISGAGTGISAADRGRTVRRLADPDATYTDFARPGHVVPVRTNDGGVLECPREPEAAVDFALLAGRRPAGLFSHVVSAERPTELATKAELEAFAREHALTVVSLPELVAYRRNREPAVRRVSTTELHLWCGRFQAVEYECVVTGERIVALVHGDVAGTGVPVRVHRECLACDLYGAQPCGCGESLGDALAGVAATGFGVVVHLRDHGTDLRHREPVSDSWPVAWILRDLEVSSVVSRTEGVASCA
jgi:3,4-dihydroxy 2-butanone 4-phosphate synthase/GTP cyclohydrolase II